MEKLFQYLWKSRMFGMNLRGCDGASVEVIDPGRLNTDAGPDFFNSKVRINGQQWAGNIEIHVKASDWHRHGHDADPAYDGIILHVVNISDERIRRRDGTLIPQVEITLPQNFYLTYATLLREATGVKCSPLLPGVSSLAKTDWLESLAVERLQMKARRVRDIHAHTGGDWEQTCFIVFARALGFSLNGDPFEMLARSVPLKYLHHHSDNLFQIESILFGQAGMLDSSLHIFDEYYQMMCREYYFLARKYGLSPMRGDLWKYSRTRPQNFPHRRVALLAKACEGGFSLFSRLLASAGRQPDDMRGLFAFALSGYWSTHFSFDVQSHTAPDSLSDASVTLLLINVVAPILYACGAMRGDYDLAEKGMSLLEALPPENNSFIRQWHSAGLTADSAWRSQALLHLRREYCDARKCLFCRFGSNVLRRAMRNQE